MHTVCNVVNKHLLYTIGISIQYSVRAHMGKTPKKSGCICNWFTLLYAWNPHSIVNQLYPNKIFFEKRISHCQVRRRDPRAYHCQEWGVTSCSLTGFFKTFFWSCPTAYRMLVPQPGIELVSLALEVQSLDHWTTREVPSSSSRSSWCLWEGCSMGHRAVGNPTGKLVIC